MSDKSRDFSFSPKPVPRRIAKQPKRPDDEDDYSMSTTTGHEYILHQTDTLLVEDESPSSPIHSKTVFSSSTMPTPRKPRRAILLSHRYNIANTSDSQTTTSTTNTNTTTSLSTSGDSGDHILDRLRADYSFDKFQIDITKSSLLLFDTTVNMDEEDRAPFMMSTLDYSSRSSHNPLKRPHLPPPPLPKHPPPAIVPNAFSTPHKTYLNEAATPVKLGFENLERFHTPKPSFIQYFTQFVKARLKNGQIKVPYAKCSTRTVFNSLVGACVCFLFVTCILSISLFQSHVHTFYERFFEQIRLRNESFSAQSGSSLVNQTILLCNGPLFSYQLNNLLVLPFSIALLVVFSCFTKRNTNNACFFMQRPGFPASVNPFKRQNRFLNAALYCILANEIFRMIESNMFDTRGQHNATSTSELFNSILFKQSLLLEPLRNESLMRIGLGLQEDSLMSTSTQRPVQVAFTKSLFVFEPSILRYSKPKLPPRLKWKDFETTTTTSTKPSTIASSSSHLSDMLG